MTHTLELSPDVERALEAKARRRGVSLAVYLRDVAQRDAATPDVSGEVQSTQQAARRALETLAGGTRAGLPPIPDEALTSASIYAGRGEINP